MTHAAPARSDIYVRVQRHNRRIAILRWAVPVAGIVLLSLPLLDMAAGRFAEMLPATGVRLESDTLVIEGPRFIGRTPTGTNYAMEAARAETRVGDLDTADLFDLSVAITDDAGYVAQARFSSATWTMSAERLVSNEDVSITDSTGASGVLGGVEVDWPAQIVSSEGPVNFAFETGAHLTADTMIHDMGAARWWFTGVTIDMIPQPDAGADRDPFAPEPQDDPL